MSDLNKEFQDKELIKSLLAFCINYINRTEYLEKENRILPSKRRGIEKNYRNAERIIPVLEEILNG